MTELINHTAGTRSNKSGTKHGGVPPSVSQQRERHLQVTHYVCVSIFRQTIFLTELTIIDQVSKSKGQSNCKQDGQLAV